MINVGTGVHFDIHMCVCITVNLCICRKCTTGYICYIKCTIRDYTYIYTHTYTQDVKL